MKRARNTSKATPTGGNPPIPKIVLAPVRRIYMNISVEVLTEQTVGCQDAGCESRAALRVRRLDVRTPAELLLCTHHAQVTVAQLREHLRSAVEAGPPLWMHASIPPHLDTTIPPASTLPPPPGDHLSSPFQPQKGADGSPENEH